MSQCKRKAIIFDLGRVLVDFDHMIAARRLSEYTNRPLREIFSLIFDSGLTRAFEKGQISPRNFFLKLKKRLKLKISYNDFLFIWNEIFFLTSANQKVYRLAKALKKNYIIALLSNINTLHFRYLRKKFSFFDVFDKIFLSYRMRSRKPSPLIYKKVMKALRARPCEIIYTDDRPDLVKTAGRLGICAFRFQGINKLKNDFVKSGVKLKRYL
jgi:putative hydrolase of the HAD superfamily